MARKPINISTPNDGLGAALRKAFDYVNQMFIELYSSVVFKVSGKDLSDNNLTDELVTKINSIEDLAQQNVQSDWTQDDDTQTDFIKNKPPELLAAVGYFDYDDLATQTTPISIIGGGADVLLTNDTLGDYTNIDQAPYGVTRLWNPITNSFDFSELSIGDTVDIRLDLALTTTSLNTQVSVDLTLGDAFPFITPFITPTNYKDVVTNSEIIRFNGIYIGSEDVQLGGGQFFARADKNCSIKVNGWYCRVIRKGVNIIDISDKTKLSEFINNGNGSTGDAFVNLNTPQTIAALKTFKDEIRLDGTDFDNVKITDQNGKEIFRYDTLDEVLYLADGQLAVENDILNIPNSTIALIEEGGDKVAVTKEYLLSKIPEIEDVDPLPNEGNTISDAWSVGGMDVRAYATNAPILDGIYTGAAQTITLAAADPTFPRYSAIVMDVNGIILEQAGTSEAVAIPPAVDEDNYFLIRYLFIPAGATTPEDEDGNTPSVYNLFYDEAGTEAGGESDVTTNNPTAITINEASSPFGGVGIRAVNPRKNGLDKIYFTHTSKKLFSGFTDINFNFKLDNANAGLRIFLSFYNGNVRVASNYFGTGQFGFDANSTDLQNISVPKGFFNLLDTEFDSFKFYVGAPVINIDGYWLDDVQLLDAFSSNPNNPITPQVQVDWNQTDENAVDFIKNKPPTTRITNPTVTGTYNLDHSLASDWKLTLTGDTTITESNLPSGADTLEFTIKVFGNFIFTVPLYWDVVGDPYNPIDWNFYAVQIHNGVNPNKEATVFLSNL